MIPGRYFTTEEPEPIERCDRCGTALYSGDYLTTVDGEKLCDDCLNDDYRRML